MEIPPHSQRRIEVSQLRRVIPSLLAGDKIFLTGYIYTGRDAAHKRFAQLIAEGSPLPFPIKDGVIYYAGPTGTKPGMVIGSCGPTTSGRMDKFAPQLLDMGLCAMIGKGERSKDVKEAIVRNGAAYFCAIGGAGALACGCIKECEVTAFPELGCESVKRLYIQDFPLIVAIDCKGNDLFRIGREKYRENAS